MQQPDKRQELCNQFREALRRPVSERFFDEDELVTIFDFAGDLEDDYIRFEVLLLGARLYPDSEALLERRAIYYEDFEGASSENFLADNASCQSAMWQILRLRKEDPFIGATPEAFDYLLDQFSTFSDEEVVQLIKTIEECNAIMWLIENFDKLLAKVSYQPILYYEAAMLYERVGFFDKEADMLDKLVELEPFSADYWTLLAAAQLSAHNPQAANQAIDYSLALEPQSAEAQMLQVNIIKELKGNKEALEYLLKSYNTVNHNPITARIISLMYEQAGQKAKLKAHVKSTLEEFPDDLFMLCDALRLHVGNATKNINNLVKHLDDLDLSQDAPRWMSMVLYLMSEQSYHEADEAIRIFNKNSFENIPDKMLQYLAPYMNGDLERCEKLLSKEKPLLQYNPDIEFKYNFSLMSAVVLARQGKSAESLEYISQIEQMLKDERPLTFDSILHYKGIQHIANDIKSRLQGDTPTDWTTYNPFSL